MLNVLGTKDLKDNLAKELSLSHSVIVLSAYVTKSGLDWLLSKLPVDTRLLVVGRFLPRDLLTGASDVEAIRTLLENGHVVKSLDSLHAKIIYIDNKSIFLGSANLTGKGLGLVKEHNLEASIKFETNEKSDSFISNVVNNANEITFDILEKMESYLSKIDHFPEKNKKQLREWPKDTYAKPLIKQLYVKDFPLAPFGKGSSFYEIDQNIGYAKIYSLRGNESLAMAAFKESNSYLWLMQLLKKEENVNGVAFGKLSSYLHDVLVDDPKPYRKEVKNLQVNFYTYLEEYASDVIEIYTPGRRSQIIRLR